MISKTMANFLRACLSLWDFHPYVKGAEGNLFEASVTETFEEHRNAECLN